MTIPLSNLDQVKKMTRTYCRCAAYSCSRWKRVMLSTSAMLFVDHLACFISVWSFENRSWRVFHLLNHVLVQDFSVVCSSHCLNCHEKTGFQPPGWNPLYMLIFGILSSGWRLFHLFAVTVWTTHSGYYCNWCHRNSQCNTEDDWFKEFHFLYLQAV